MTALSASVFPWIVRLLFAYAFLLPFSSKYASIVLAPLFVCCLIYKISEKKLFRFSSFIFFWMIVLYLLHVAGLIYTENTSYAGLDLQIKLSFLLMPVLLDQLPLSNGHFRRLSRTFLASCTLLALILITNAIMEYAVWGHPSSFFYIDFCSIQHVAYLSLYINLALFFLIDEFYRLPGYRLRNRYLLAVWMLFLIAVLILLSSRTAQFAAFISLTVYFFLLTSQVKSKVTACITSGSAALLMLLMFNLISGSYNRFGQPDVAAPVQTEAVNTEHSSTVRHNVRFELWQHALSVYSRHPVIGVGTGDIKDELRIEYENNGFREGLDFNLSPHNQFLHTLVALGIPGLLTLLLIFTTAYKRARLYKNNLLIVLLLTVLINCLTEGILEKQAGVLFFVFFVILVSGLPRRKKI